MSLASSETPSVSEIRVQLPDGALKSYRGPITPLEIAAEIGARLAKATLAAVVNGKVVSAQVPLSPNDAGPNGVIALRLLTAKDPEAVDVMRHSCAHVMARAVMRLFPNVELAFGPTIEHGFYYDFGLDRALGEEDFAAIEAEMAKIVKADEPFEYLVEPRDKSIAICQELNQKLKVEHIQTGLAEHPTLSFYRQGEFIDLCRGPHLPSAGAIGAFKLLSVAGAYWKGKAENQQLQRVYATAFFDKQALEQHLTAVEEAKRRDHRVLGKKLELFHISPMVGSGLVLWLPKGASVRGTLESYLRDELTKRGYDAVYTPNIGRVELYQTSGHFPYYADSQFKLIEMSEEERYLLKPMNCPHHIMIFKSKPRSYRELPVRLAEFGTVYRYEQSGELSGMTRVRGFTQDDAHIFCTAEQVAEEFRSCIELTQSVLASVGMHNYRVRLGFRDPASDKYVGGHEIWNEAESALERVCREMSLPDIEVEKGEAAFYGPKADFVVQDCLGREWQLGTVQLDYNLPSAARFGLEFIGPDNKPHQPVMIHRAPFGSMERFIGVLIEHFAGAFPLWLAPEQARVLLLKQDCEPYARKVEDTLRQLGFRVRGDYRSETLGSKIRDAQLELTPYMLIIGAKEQERGEVAVRDRIEGDLGSMTLETLIDRLQQEVRNKTVRQTANPSLVSLTDRSKRETEAY